MTGKKKNKILDLKIFYRLLFSFIGTSLLAILIMGSVYYYFAKRRANVFVKREVVTALSNAVSYFESNYKNPIYSDLTLLESSPSLENFLTATKNDAFFIKFDIEKMFHRLVKSKDSLYRSIGFFDAYGNEKILIKDGKRQRNLKSISQYKQGSPLNQGQASVFNKLTQSLPGTILFDGPFENQDNRQIMIAGIAKREPEIAGFGGVIMLSFDLTDFITYLSNIKIFDKKIAWLFSKNGKILLSPPDIEIALDPRHCLDNNRPQADKATVQNGNNYHIKCDTCVMDISNKSFIKIAFSVPKDVLSVLMNEALLRGLIIITIVLCIAILISYILASQIVKPILELSNASELISRGNFDVNIESEFGGEIGDLALAFNRMSTEIFNREKKLEESESKFRRLTENAKDVIYRMLLPEGVYEYINSASTDLFGYTPIEFYETPLFIQKIIHPDWQDYFFAEWEKLKKGVMLPTFEYQVIHKSGEVRWMHQRNVLIKDEKGNPIAHEGIVTDITRQKNAVKESQKLELALQQSQKMEAIGTLAGGIAHDFNNILAVIMGNADIARYYILDGNFPKNEINEILKASKRAKDLISHILTFSRKSLINDNSIHVNLLVKETLNLIRSTTPSTIEIKKNLCSDCGRIYADSTKIYQLIINLCTNAAQAMDKNGGVMTVTLSCENTSLDDLKRNPNLKAGRYIKISVKDTGHGIHPEIINRIFDPYFSTKPVGKGSGMGLAIVHGIVTRYKGAITVDSVPGKGSKFTVFFPEISKFVKETKTPVTEPVLQGNEKVLLVDDEETVLKVTEKKLKHLGYQVTSVMSSMEAYNLFKSSPGDFDILVTDQAMPKMTGKKLSEKILDLKKDFPIILCTGYSNKIDQEIAEKTGIKLFLMKPIPHNDLAKSIRMVLDGLKLS